MSSWRDFLKALPAKCADAKTANSAKTPVWRPNLDPFGTNGTIGIETFTAESAKPRPVANALPGVPDEWWIGVALIRSGSAPSGISADRWLRFGRSCERLMVEQGAALQAAGWDGLDLFGLHAHAPDTRPDCWGLGWLVRELRFGRIAPDTVALVAESGAVMHARKLGQQGRIEAVLAWDLR